VRAAADIVHLLALDMHAADEYRVLPIRSLLGGGSGGFRRRNGPASSRADRPRSAAGPAAA
jgi:hypothetical protein